MEDRVELMFADGWHRSMASLGKRTHYPRTVRLQAVNQRRAGSIPHAWGLAGPANRGPLHH